jgi:hypothetical protein
MKGNVYSEVLNPGEKSKYKKSFVIIDTDAKKIKINKDY